MAHIVHVIQELSRGGGARATIYLAKYSAILGSHSHSILSLKNPDPEAVAIARQNNINVLHGLEDSVLREVLFGADIVQYSWWNNVDMQRLFSKGLPPMRSVGWFHVGGTASPQVITPKVVDYFDYAVACSPYTYKCAAIQSMSPADREERTAMVYGATDFSRLHDIKPKVHEGFNVGYIGTLDFLKMHRNYVSMSAKAKIPNAKFVFCGSGEAVNVLFAEASAIGQQDRFEYKGYLEDIRDILSVLDVYGYPLCAETYAASEMNLQEVMYAGIPPVVFPHGGVQDLVIHNQTGLIVHTEEEYTQALEYLYNNPDERKRLGANAHKYAASVFGAENAGLAINKIYDKLLQKPKREPVWGGTTADRRSGRMRIGIDDLLFSNQDRVGHKAFIESLGFQSTIFVQSLYGDNVQKLSADIEIYNSPAVVRQSGTSPYKNEYPGDPYLQYWDGLANLGAGLYPQAVFALVEASKNIQEWRLFYFLAKAAKGFGQEELYHQAMSLFEQVRKAQLTEEEIRSTDILLQNFA